MTTKEITNKGTEKQEMASGDRRVSPVASLQQEVNRVFDTFFDMTPFGGLGLSPFRFAGTGTSAMVPRVDITENDKELRISAELPGIEEKDIRVSLDGHMLRIEGEKKIESQENERGYYR